ncbi:hypothetical protein ACKWTF_013279 [Chironomus riparius]
MNIVKIAVVGDSVVGKTCLIYRYCHDIFLEQDNSLNIDKEETEVTIDGTNYTINLVEPKTDEDANRYRPFYYKNSKVIILCFGIEDRLSFENISNKWIPDLKHLSCKPISFILVATKIDLRDDSNSSEAFIKTAEGEGLAKKIGARRFIECSAMSNVGVKDAIEEALRVATDKVVVIKAKEHSCVVC